MGRLCSCRFKLIMAEFCLHRLSQMALCLCLASVLASPVPPQGAPIMGVEGAYAPAVTGAAQTLAKESRTLASDTATIADKVIASGAASKKKLQDAKTETMNAEAAKALETKKMLDEVKAKTEEALKANEEADAKAEKITKEAASSITDIVKDKDKHKVDTQANLAKSKADTQAVAAQQKLALSLKKEGDMKKAKEITTKAFKDMQTTESKGSQELVKRVNEVINKASTDLENAKGLALSDAARETAPITALTKADLEKAEVQRKAAVKKILDLKSDVIKAKAESMDIARAKFEELLNIPALNVAPTGKIVGDDIDSHGCKMSAGFMWCEEKKS